jgi:hypothetical protein
MLKLLLLVSPALGIIEIPIKPVQTSPDSQTSDLPLPEEPLKYSDYSIENLETYDNIHYTGRVSIGSPPQDFYMVFDLTTNWIWVPGTECSSCQDLMKFETYRSNTFYYEGGKDSIHHNNYHVSGTRGSDTIAMGNYEVDETQTFLVLDYQHGFDVPYTSGVIGLGFRDSKELPRPFIQTLKKHGVIDYAIFSLYISKNYDSFQESVLTIGGYDASRFGSDSHINWIDIEDTGYWEVAVDEVRYSGRGSDYDTTAVFNSTTQYIHGPKKAVNKIYESILNYSGGRCEYRGITLVCDCESVRDYEYMEFYIDGYIFKLDGGDLFRNDNGRCRFEVVGWNEDFWALGMSFLRSYYTIYDMDDMQIGIAGWVDTYDDDNHEEDGSDDEDTSYSTQKYMGMGFGVFFSMNLVGGIWIIFRAFERTRLVGDQFLT